MNVDEAKVMKLRQWTCRLARIQMDEAFFSEYELTDIWIQLAPAQYEWCIIYLYVKLPYKSDSFTVICLWVP